MRITITSMIGMMILILVAGIVAVRVLSPDGNVSGCFQPDVFVVLFETGAEEGGLGEPFFDSLPLSTEHDGARWYLRPASSIPTSYIVSVASLLTGLNPQEHMVSSARDVLSPALCTLAESFARSGYQTHALIAPQSPLESCALLGGFMRVVAHRGRDSAPAILGYLAAHRRAKSPFFGFVEISESEAGSSEDLHRIVRDLVQPLREQRFFRSGLLILCFGGGSPTGPAGTGRPLLVLGGAPCQRIDGSLAELQVGSFADLYDLLWMLTHS